MLLLFNVSFVQSRSNYAIMKADLIQGKQDLQVLRSLSGLFSDLQDEPSVRSWWTSVGWSLLGRLTIVFPFGVNGSLRSKAL